MSFNSFSLEVMKCEMYYMNVADDHAYFYMKSAQNIISLRLFDFIFIFTTVRVIATESPTLFPLTRPLFLFVHYNALSVKPDDNICFFRKLTDSSQNKTFNFPVTRASDEKKKRG